MDSTRQPGKCLHLSLVPKPVYPELNRGDVFRHLTVQSKAYGGYPCKCFCGNELILSGADLCTGKRTNCGSGSNIHT